MRKINYTICVSEMRCSLYGNVKSQDSRYWCFKLPCSWWSSFVWH